MVSVPTVVTPASDEGGVGSETKRDMKDFSNGNAEANSHDARRGHHRRRSSSFVMVKHVPETPDQLVDQTVAPNANAEWVNMKGGLGGLMQVPG